MTTYRCRTGGRAGASGIARRQNLRPWVRCFAAVCLAFPVHFSLAADKASVTIVDLDSLARVEAQKREAQLNETAVASRPAGGAGLPPLFSPDWEKLYSSAKVGCHLGRKRYVWRPCGFGSNIVHLLNAFVYGLSVKHWIDVAVITPAGQLDLLHCTGEKGVALSGFDCLFRPMPHVCTFGSIEEWKRFMTTKTVRKIVQDESEHLDWQYIRLQQRMVQRKALEQYGVDSFGALAVMARYLWENIEPALQEHVRQEVERPGLDIFHQSPYVGLHIRRGDKVSEGEMEFIETKEYLAAAKKYLEDDTATDRTPVGEIKSIFVASDDGNAVNEVRALARGFFPNVELDNIAWISAGGKDGTVQTRSKLESYNGFIFILADLQLLASADVFVGTYTSNVSRLVALLREGINGRPRDSCISLDKEQFDLNYRRLQSSSGRSHVHDLDIDQDLSGHLDPWFA